MTYNQFHNKYKKNLRHLVSEARELAQFEVALTAKSAIYQELTQEAERYGERQLFASGGMKEILCARDLSTGRDIAMAVIASDSTPGQIESFLREARITAQLQHPNIVPVYDIGIDAGARPFFTMKLIEGDTLARILAKLKEGDEAYLKLYPLSVLTDIFHKLCEAVAYAHSKGIIHLDLKPANIQVSSFGEVLLCDWGLAKVQDEFCEEPEIERYSLDQLDMSNLTLDGYIKGTPDYMAPEQTGKYGKCKDHRTDIYSLGAILYSLLTLRRIIAADGVKGYIEKCRAGEIVPPSQRTPERRIPNALEAVAMKALSVEPELRYQSALELAGEIQAYTTGFATSAEGADFFTQTKLMIVRHRGIAITVGLSAVVLLLFVTFFIVGLSASEKAAVKAKHQTEAALRKYRSEQSERMKLAKETAVRYFEKAKMAFDNYQHTEAVKLLKTSLELDPENQQSRVALVQNLFCLGQFNAAQQVSTSLIEKPSKTLQTLFQLTKKEPLGRFVLSDILDQLKASNATLYQHCLFTLPNLMLSQEELLKLLEERLVKDNSEVENLQISYDKATDAVSVAGNHSLKNGRALAMLKVKRLDLSHSGITHIDFLRHMGITSLNLSHCPVEDITPIVMLSLDDCNLSFTPIRKFVGLEQVKFKRVNIVGTRIPDLGMLVKNPYLEKLTLMRGGVPLHWLEELRQAGKEVIEEIPKAGTRPLRTAPEPPPRGAPRF